VPNSWSLRPRDQLRIIAWQMWHPAAGCLSRSEWTTGGHELDDHDVECPMTADGGIALLPNGLSVTARSGRSRCPHDLDRKLPHHCAEMAMLRDLFAPAISA
jgi:hypothetical protein